MSKVESADLILKLYDLRREPKMREARNWIFQFNPTSVEDYWNTMMDPQVGGYLRMVSSYWDMAASFVLRGALNEDLFVDSGTEMWFVFAKLQPFLKDVRQQGNTPYLYARIEKLATRSKEGREKMQMMAKRAESMRARAAKA